MKKLIEFLIRRFLPGFHLSRNPVRKANIKEATNGNSQES